MKVFGIVFWLVAFMMLPFGHTLKMTYKYRYDNHPWVWHEKCFFGEVSIPTPPNGDIRYKIIFRVDGATTGSSFGVQIKHMNIAGIAIGDNEWTPNDKNLHWEKVIDVRHDKPWDGKLCIKNLQSFTSTRVRVEMIVVKTLTMLSDGDKRLKRAQDDLVKLYSNLGSKISFPFKNIGYDPLPSEGKVRRPAMIFLAGGFSTGKTTLVNRVLTMDRIVDVEDEMDVESNSPSATSPSSHPAVRTGLLSTGVAPTTEDFTLITGNKFGGQDQLFTGFDAIDDATRDIVDEIPNLESSVKKRIFENFPFGRQCVIVDSPGILSVSKARNARPYDYEKAMVAFAKAADLVFFLFSPEHTDIGGTVMDILNKIRSALWNTPKKLYILLNKADMAETVTDLLKAYGTIMFNMGLSSKDGATRREIAGNVYITSFKPPGVNQKMSSWGKEEFEEQADEILNIMENIKFRSVELRITNAIIYFRGLSLYLHTLLEIWPTTFWDSWLCLYFVSESRARELLDKQVKIFLKSVSQFSHTLDRLATQLSSTSIRLQKACLQDSHHGLPTRHTLVSLLEEVDKMTDSDLRDLRQTQKMIAGNSVLDTVEKILLPLDQADTQKENL